MPRYFLNVREGGEWIEDEEGSEHPDLDAARLEALLGARDILTDQIQAGEVLNLGTIEIADGDGVILAVVPFTDALKYR